MKRHILLAAMAAASLAPIGAQANEVECQRSDIHAEFETPKDGKFYVNHQAGTLDLGTGDPAGLGSGAMISTTGFVDVKITHGCAKVLHLTVTKDGAVIHQNTFETSCDEGETTDSVEIGLNAGEYVFSLDESLGCNGKPLRHAGDGHYVGDPPLPI